MEVINLSNHSVRKALQLSLNEMAVLCDIKKMSQNRKFDYWCIKSKDKIADWLDLSRATVFRAIDTLILKGYIEKSEKGLRLSTFASEIDLAQDEIGIYIKNNDVELISAKMKSILHTQSQNDTMIVSKCDGDSLKMILSQSQNETQDIHINKSKKKNNNISSVEDSNNHADKMSVKMYEQNIDGNCTFPILDSTEPIYEPKPKETKPKVKEKKPSKYDANPERFKFINEKTKEWNLTASDDIKIRPPRKGEKESNNWVISRLYDKFGLEKAEIIFNYVMSKGNYRQPHGLLSTKNVQDALASYQDPNNEQPRFLIDFWKTMRRFSAPDSLEPFELDFNTEDALYASWEWYFNGRGLEGGELVKAVREKIKQINHPRFNKY